MRTFEERKLEIFKRSKERIAVKKKRRNIFIACISLCLCISIVSAVLIPKLNIFGGNNSSLEGTENQSSTSKPNTSSDRVTSGGGAQTSEIEETKSNKVINLMAEVKPNKISALNDINSQNIKATDFALRLFKASQTKGKNALISPLSVLSALAMTANGAEGKTLSQMEKVLGMSRDELNLYFYSYMQDLPVGDQYKLRLANSIWFTGDEDFKANQDFLQSNADFYNADIYKARLDRTICKNINNWVAQKTDNMIPSIIDQIPPETVMCLVNALAFEAEWDEPYTESSVSEGTFTMENGETYKAVQMSCTVNKYLEDKNATGFIKYYKNEKYAFVALLPKKGVSVDKYLSSLDGKSLNKLLSNPKNTSVKTLTPHFEATQNVKMTDILTTMGMKNAFSPTLANFKSIGTLTNGNIYIGNVIHKSVISVTQKGTMAGAETVVLTPSDNTQDFNKPKEVYLDRPFVYMLIDCENNVPFFIGTMMDLNS